MLAGVSKKMITPDAGIDLAGFGRLDRKNIGVHDNLHVTTLALKQNEKCVLIICADLIGFGFQLTKDIKNDIKKKYGLTEDEILLNASHTHSGPQTLENMLVTLGKRNENYVRYFKECVLSSVDEALSSMEEISIYYGKTECNIGINRRLILDGKANFQPNEKGLSDKSVTVMKIMKDDVVKAVLFSYACHPSTIGADYVSADYPGAAKRLIESELGIKTDKVVSDITCTDNGIVALFMQECCGNIRVRTIKDDNFISGTWEDVNKFGVELGSTVVKLCKSEMKQLKEDHGKNTGKSVISTDNSSISTDIKYIELPFKGVKTEEKLKEIKLNGNVHEQLWAENMLENYNILKDTVTFTIQKIELNKEFSIIAMGGEVVAEYGLYVKNIDPDKTVISAAYSNGLAGYIPTDEMFEQGGYEPDGSTIYYLYPSQLENSIEKVIYDNLNKIAK
mgnify:FL=1